MKATINFDLHDPDDQRSHERCVKSLQMAIILWELTCHGPAKFETLDQLYEWLNTELIDRGINIENLVS